MVDGEVPFEWRLREHIESRRTLSEISKLEGVSLGTLRAMLRAAPRLEELYANMQLVRGVEADREHVLQVVARERLRRTRRREQVMLERERGKRRAVELRAGGRSGVRIAARLGIGLRTLRNWQSQDEDFRAHYEGVYMLWKQGNDVGLRALLGSYHPERQGTRDRPTMHQVPQGRAG